MAIMSYLLMVFASGYGTEVSMEPGANDAVEAIHEGASDQKAFVIDTIDAVCPTEWNAFVDRSSHGCVFHRYEWLAAIENGLGYTPAHIVITKDGNPIGICPNFVIGMNKTPFHKLTSVYPGFGGPLISTDVPESLSLMMDTISSLCSGRTIVHEIRALDTNYLKYSTFLRNRGYRPSRRYCRFQLDLTAEYETILDGMSSSRRKGIERGREHDYEIIETAVTDANLERFHDVHEQVMDRVDGESYPLAFFEELQELSSQILLLSIRIDGEYAGGMLELLDDDHARIYGFIAAVPAAYFEYNASELLYDHVIRWGIENGYETYDLGSTNADFENGVFRFKEGFGGTMVPSLIWERGNSVIWKPVKTGRSLYDSYVA